MSKQEKTSSTLIRAAGGLLWRSFGGTWQIAVIHRPRYDDWTLPKGKLKSGESWQQAALREVREETGYSAQITGFAGAVAYTTMQGLKVVRFWHMLTGDKVSDIAGDEVSELLWLTREDALKKLEYSLDLALLEIWNGPVEIVE